MTVNSIENKTTKETSTALQTFILRFVVLTAILLVALPTVPTLISNLVYSFSGASPKIYWYLSRASGFVTLTILWVSMALGLGITNKMVRLWPGAPTSFAMHQFTSLLGLAFSAYHALVLMGDHFVDFSLPRLLMPFSIAYETFWVGLGQVGFYLWIVAVVSFYFRQRIGQKAWRLIHYVNFAVYAMAFLHGLNSGTDSHETWVVWYYAISGMSIMILLGYRISDTILKKRIELPKLTFPRFPPVAENLKTVMRSLPHFKVNLPKAHLLLEQMKRLAPKRRKISEQILERIEASPSPIPTFETNSAKEAPKEKLPAKKLEGTIQGNKIRVRIFREPTDTAIPEFQNGDGSKQPRVNILFHRMRDTLQKTPAEPVVSDRRSKKSPFSED